MKLLTKTITNNDPTATLEVIGPEQAAAMLECNQNNRSLSQRVVDQYATDMANNEWHLTGEPIKFDIDGDLLDGQHRLWAVVQSGATIQTIVVRGLRPDAQDVMDTGRKRSASDMFKLNGYKNPAALAATVRLLWNYENGLFKRAAQVFVRPITNAQTKAYVEVNPDVIDAVRWGNSHRMPNLRVAVGSASLCVLRRIDHAQADEFMTDLHELRTSGKGDPRLTLLRRLESARDEKVSAVEEMHYVFRTWNAVRQGEELRQLKTGNNKSSFDFARPQ